jgi:hypothetical protein
MAEKLAKLKKEYSELEKKYKLPSFRELNEEFDIEKVQEIETETLLREIRKVTVDKVLSYLRFVELLLNPSQAPMFFFALLKNMDAADKKTLEDLYSNLGKLEVDVIEVDNVYSEKSEADFIRHVFSEWKGIKENMSKISSSLKKSWDKKSEKKSKSYLG